MEVKIFRIACAVYLVSFFLTAYAAFSPNPDAPAQVQAYMQWWYSQPNSTAEVVVSYLAFAALVLSVISAFVLLFLKKWAGYVFIACAVVLATTEWVIGDYVPQSGLEKNMDSIVSISMGFILCAIVFAEKLGVFSKPDVG